MSKYASIDAIAWEAKNRGVSYGELVAHLTKAEEMDIAARYRVYQGEKKCQEARRLAEKPAGRRRKRKKEEC